MIFSSYTFILIYLPIVLLGFYILRKLGKILPLKIWLIGASLAFYAAGQIDYAGVFVVSLLLNYAIVYLMDKTDKRPPRVLLLLLATIWNIGLLIYYKYTNFILENLNRIPGVDFTLLKLILPIGISFFTFQILAYTIDCYRGKTKRSGVLDYFLFVCFFPQLIVGPVVMHDELMPQIEGNSLLKLNVSDVQRGIYLFSIGCAKKIIIANPLITYAENFYRLNPDETTQIAAWTGVLAFTFAYYFDFSGYVDMARGLGYMFGINLPVNFDSPYKARNFADFWRRWNMTISRFFYNTVYASIFKFGDRIPKMIIATIATFAVSGVWHGAGWNFILWGVVNGMLVCAANIMMLYRLKLPSVVAYPATFISSCLVRVLFDAHSISQSLGIYRKLFDFSMFANGLKSAVLTIKTFCYGNLEVVFLIIVGAAICFLLPNSNKMSERETFTARHAVFSAALLAFSFACMGRVSAFLYFNF